MAFKHPSEAAIANREDISQFVVHLTRDDRGSFDNGSTARDNFISIYKQKTIMANRAHCLHNRMISSLPELVQQEMRVACFTEVPLNQIHLLIRPIPGRQVEFAPYGFVFKKSYIVRRGAQPAIYVNSYNGNMFLREAADALFEKAKAEDFQSSLWKFLPFLNAMHENYDFTWEREWRVRHRLEFSAKDLVCVILPQDSELELKKSFSKGGIAVISPGWNYEQIVAELARQQRETVRVMLANGPSAAKPATKTERADESPSGAE